MRTSSALVPWSKAKLPVSVCPARLSCAPSASNATTWFALVKRTTTPGLVLPGMVSVSSIVRPVVLMSTWAVPVRTTPSMPTRVTVPSAARQAGPAGGAGPAARRPLGVDPEQDARAGLERPGGDARLAGDRAGPAAAPEDHPPSALRQPRAVTADADAHLELGDRDAC